MRTVKVIGLICLLGLLVGCVAPTAQPLSPERSLAATATPSATLTPRPTVSPTRTPIPSATVTPTFTPSPTPCAANGTLQRVEIAVAALRRPMPVQVYLPPCYPQQAQYPVLFLLHGQNADEGQWPRLGIAEAADRLIRSQAIRPLIIVMPREEYWWINPFDGPFEASFFEGLMPWVEASYPICAGAGCRALGGLSRGAAWAVNLGFSHPGVFGSIGAHSLPPFSGDAERLPYWLRAFGEQPLPKLYLDVGEKDRYHKATEQFEKTLTDLQVPHEWVLQPGAHDEAYWAAHVEDYLRWYDQAWALPARAD
ncbi:MAG: hypothetical protein KA988_02705 [Longilinea sp.]|nr:hypothetical protein [Longilinea sp.]